MGNEPSKTSEQDNSPGTYGGTIGSGGGEWCQKSDGSTVIKDGDWEREAFSSTWTQSSE